MTTMQQSVSTAAGWKARRRRVLAAIRAAICAAIGCGMFVVATTAEAATIAVNTEAELATALQTAASGDVIDIQSNITLTESLQEMDRNITLTIEGNGNQISGAGAYQIFKITDGTVTIQNVTLANGLAEGGAGASGNGGGGGGLGAGGALYVGTGNGGTDASVTLENVIFTGNEAAGGTGGTGTGSGTNGGNGGVYNANANPANPTFGGTAGYTGGVGGSGSGVNEQGTSGNPNGAAYGGGGPGSGINGTSGGTGNGGGSGGAKGVGGGGGGALGGAVFVSNGSTLTIRGTTGIAADNTSTGGAGGTGSSASGNAGFNNGGGLYVGIGSTTTLDTSLNNITITGDVYSNGNLVHNNATGIVTFTGNAEVTSNGAVNVTTGTVNFNGPSSIISGTLNGAGRLFFNGTGTSIITGNSTNFTGTMTANTGTLQGNTAGLRGNIVNNSVVRFQNTNVAGTPFDGGFNGTISGSGDVIIAGNTTQTGIVTFTTANTYTGDTTIDGGRLRGNVESLDDTLFLNGGTSEVIFNQSIGAPSTSNYNGVISGAGRVSLAGSSLVIFTQAQSYTGTTFVNNGGGLQGTTDSVQGTIVNNTLVTFSQAVNGTYSGNMSGAGGLISNVTQTLNFTGDNTYIGGTTVNSGTLQGDTGAVQGNIRNNSVVAFSQTGTGTYSGVISGAGAVLLNNTGTVIFTGANTYTGVTTVANGTLQGNTTSIRGTITDNADLVFNQTTTGSFNGTINGTGDVTKLGAGNLIFTSPQAYAGVTTVSAGRLSNNSTMASDVVVNSGGTFGGTGTTFGDVNNFGIVAPGNSIGTMTVGNYNGNSGSTLQVEVNNAGTTPGVNSDYLVVTGNLNPNGETVSVVTNTSVGFTSGTQYTIISYTGNRLSSFGAATINTPFLTPTISYEDSLREVYLTLFRSSTTFASEAQTPNQFAVATYIDQNSSSASGDFATVVDQVALLSAADARTAFDQMTGVIYGSAARINVQNTTYMMMQIQRNTGFEGDFGSPRDFWGNPIVDSDSDANPDIVLVGRFGDEGLPIYHVRGRQRWAWNAWSTGYGSAESSDEGISDYATAGNITSVYRYLNDFVKVGAFGAYNYLKLETPVPFQSHTTNDGQFGSYVRVDDGLHHFLAAGSGGIDSHSSTRFIDFGTINRTATAEYDGWQSTGYFEFGRKFFSYPIDFQPFLGLQYTYLQQDAFTETGADSLNLNVPGIDSQALWQMLGARVTNDWLDGVFELRAIWLHDYIGSQTVLNSTFATVGGASFTTQSVDFGRNNALLGFGLTWNITERLNIAGNYDAYVTNDAIFNYGSGTLQYRW